MRDSINAVLNNPKNRYFGKVNDFLAAVTMLSIAGIALESVSELERYDSFFWGMELVAVSFFAIEYVLRVYSAKRRLRYIFSFFGLIDLVSILPSFVNLINLTFLKSARVLRILRLMRMVRLAKLARLKRPTADVEHHGAIYRLNLEIYIMTLVSAILLFGALVYAVEAPHQGFGSIPEGMLWSADVLSGGSFVEHAPSTLTGKILGIAARFTGLILLGMLIYVVGDLLRRLLLGNKDKKNTPRRKKPAARAH